MSIPIHTQTFDAFLGQQDAIHSIILPDIFSSGGSKNVWMDKFARVKRILGYAAQGAAVTTNTGGSATRVRNLFPYRKTTGGTITRQLIGVFDDGTDEWELHYSTNEGATWTFIQDLGAASVGAIADFDQFGTNLYITNGKAAVRKWDGTSISNAGSSQLAAPTVASGGTGNLFGSFTVKLVPRKSDGTRKAGSVTSAAIALEGETLSLSWVADADTNVVGYEEYRTTGTGKLFWFVQYIDGRTTVAATDNVEDLTILEQRGLDEHGDAPPQAYICAAHKQRVWYLNTDTNPQRGTFSDPGNGDSVYAENYIEFQDAETMGDFITGAYGNFENMLVVFQERSIWTVSGTGQTIGNSIDWNRTRTNAQTGSVSQRAIVKVPAGSKYIDAEGARQTTATVTLAYFTPFKDIRMFDGDNDVIISAPVSDALATLNYAQRRKVHTLHDTFRKEIAWIFPADAASEPSTAVVWNYRWGVWYVRDAWGFCSAVEVESSSEASTCLAGEGDTAIGGKTYKLWQTNTANGVAYSGRWMTKTLYGLYQGTQPAVNFQKRWRDVDCLFETSEDVDVVVGWLDGDAPDNADPIETVTLQPDTEAVMTSDGELVLTSDAEEIHVALDSSLMRASFLDSDQRYYHGNGIRLVFMDGATIGSWSLEAFTLSYQVLPGRKRRRSAELNP